MSCGALLLSSGTKGYRFMSPNATVLIHQGSVGLYGKNQDIEPAYKSFSQIDNKLDVILESNMGKRRGFLKSLYKKNMGGDIYWDAVKSHQEGLVDHIYIPRLYTELQYIVCNPHGGEGEGDE